MTKEEFAKESDPRGEMRELECVIVPCGCSDSHCPGWQWVTKATYAANYSEMPKVGYRKFRELMLKPLPREF